MEVQLAEERVLRLVPQLTFDQARAIVEEKKVSQVAGTLGALFTRPKPDEITLTYSECRYEPYWRITSHVQMSYERQRTFTVTAGGPEVKQITIFDKTVPTESQPKGAPTITFSGIEHCEEDQRLSRYFNGDGVSEPKLEKYMNYPIDVITDLANYNWEGTCENPVAKSAAIIRQVITEIVRPIKAQVIHSESILVEEIDLCFRPIYAFEFAWAAKNKRVVVECDGLTQELHNGGKTLKHQLKSLMNPDLLFDITADAAGSIVPFGGIAIKLTRAAINFKSKS